MGTGDMAKGIMKKRTFPLILIAGILLFSCTESPTSIGEYQKPFVKIENEDKLISVYVHIVKNIDYLNILRRGVSGKDSIKYGKIENIAEIIPKKSIKQSAYFSDRHFSIEYERYQYRIRYRIDGKYEFSQWSDEVSIAGAYNSPDVEDGLNYIIKKDAINMVYRDNEKLMLKEIKTVYLPESSENSDDNGIFKMSDFQNTFDSIYLDEKTYNDGYVPCLTFSYTNGENKSEKVSRVFAIDSFVIKDGDRETKEFIAVDFNIATLVTSDFFNKDVLLEGFVGEKVTNNDDDAYIKIEWTSLTPVCLYERKIATEQKDETTDDPYYKYKKMAVDKETGYSIIKITPSNQTNNNHDYSDYDDVSTNSRVLSENSTSLYRDFSVYCEG